MRKTLATLGAIASISVLAACGGSHKDAEAATPKTLLGGWHQEKRNETGVYMTADIRPGTIQIDMETRSSSSIYWLGGFDTDEDPSKPFETISMGDSDALALELFGSQDKTKKFTYKDGVISFKFKMLGTTTTVSLVKDRDPDVDIPAEEYDDPDDFKSKKPKKTPTYKAPTYKAPSTTTKKKY